MQLECECGYVVDDDDSEALVRAAQSHAREVHQVELAAPTILSIAGRRSASRSAAQVADATSFS